MCRKPTLHARSVTIEVWHAETDETLLIAVARDHAPDAFYSR
jgi:hypothetical protein